MGRTLQKLQRFFRELKRRNVYKVAVAYLAVAFMGIQAARLLVPPTTLPAWADDLIIYLAAFGFPIAVVLAWAFEMTPEGVRRTESRDGGSEPGPAFRWVGLTLAVLAAGGAWWISGDHGQGSPAGDSDAPDTAAARATAARESAGSTAGSPRLAVLPFDNIARDTGDDFFSRGMHQEVQNQLAKVSGLDLISRTSVKKFAGSGLTVREISDELGGVDVLLEGTVRRSGDQVVLSTTLIDVSTDTELWSRSYDRELSTGAIFDIQADIAERLTSALEVRLTEGERRRIGRTPTGDLAAYDAFIQGRNLVWQSWSEERLPLLERATARLRQAVRLDSTFAEAHAWMALSYTERRYFVRRPEGMVWLDSARAALEKARALDPELATVHLAQGALSAASGDPGAAEEALRRALELEPNNALATAWLADQLYAQGDYAESIRLALEAVRLDPRPVVMSTLASRLMYAGAYEPAEAWFRRIRSIEPANEDVLFGLWWVRLMEGQPDGAVDVLQRFLEETEDPPVTLPHYASEAALAAGRPELAMRFIREYAGGVRETVGGLSSDDDLLAVLQGGQFRVAPANLGLAQLRLGHTERGRAILREVADSARARLERDERPWVGNAQDAPLLAGVLAELGRTSEALDRLEALRGRGGLGVQQLGSGLWLEWHPVFDSLRSEPGFQSLLEDILERQERIRREIRRMDLDLYPPAGEG